MKKLIFTFLIFFSLISCSDTTIITEETISSLESAIQTTTILPTTDDNQRFLENENYASDVIIQEFTIADQLQQAQKYFQAYYSHVKYSPLSHTLTLTVNVSDSEYRGAEYILVGRYKDNFSEERKHFVFGESSGSLTYTFDNVNLSRTYEVLVAKIDDDDLNPSSTLYSVCTLELSDPYANERYEVFTISTTNNSPEYLNYNEIPSIDLKVVYSDENRAINQFAIGIYSNYDKTLIEEIYIDVDNTNYNQGNITLDNIIISNLSPSQEYIVQIYATGNDGIDDFTLLTLDTFLITTPTYENSIIEDSFYNLYAAITYSKRIEDKAVFYYTAINDGNYVYSDTQEPVTIMVRVMAGEIGQNYQNEYDVTFELDLSSNFFTVPYEYASKGVYIRVFDERNEYEFCEYHVYPNTISFNGFISIYQDLHFEIPDDSNVENIVSLNIKLFNSDNQLISEYNDLDTSQVQYVWDLPNEVESFEGWYIVIDYEVNSTIGILTHQQIIDLH